MRRLARPQRLGPQLADLALVQLSNWRWAWPQLVIAGLITPCASMIALGAFAKPEDRGQIFIGSLVLALLFQTLNQVAANFAFMKTNGTLDFFATQPIRRTLVPIATVAAFLVLSLPALVVTIIVGAVLLDLSISPSPLLLLVVPLATIPAAGIGALIGSLTSTIEESAAISLVVTFVMTGLGPVMIPAAKLPAAVEFVGHANPATYVASALSRTLRDGPGVDWGLTGDLLALAGFAAVTMTLVVLKMPWRGK
jgi:ABC-2 type transport system permease protein